MDGDGRGAPGAPPGFLAGGGEMGARLRAHPWAATPLGPPERWPQGLKTAVRILLTTRHPIFVFWGPEHLCLYNDAYGASLGPEKHPAILGMPGRAAWPESWDVIGPQIGMVMRGEGATWHENQLVPLLRHGAVREAYWTYSYGPIDDETAPRGVGGVLVVCTETTGQVLAGRERAREAARLLAMFEQAPGFLCVQRGPDHVYELTNAAYRALIGGRDPAGMAMRDALPELAGQGYLELLDRVYRTGEAHVGRAARVLLRRAPGAPAEERFVDFIYQPIRGEDGAVTGIVTGGTDVTDAVRAQAALRESEERFRLAVEAFRGAVYEYDPAADRAVRTGAYPGLVGLRPEEIPPGRRGWLDRIHPEDQEAVRTALAALHEGGADRTEIEYRVRHRDGRWVRAWHHALAVRDPASGRVLRTVGSIVDVTARRAVEERLRASEERLRLVVETVRDYAILTTDAAGRIDAWMPGAAAVFGWGAEEAVGRPADLIFTPEDCASGAPEAELDGARRDGAAPDVRWHLRKDGARVFIEGRVYALRGPGGLVRGFLKIGQDVTARRAAEERQALLAREVDHRAKNALAMVQAAVRLTRAPDLPSFARAVEGRVGALARAQTLLAHEGWAGADLGALLRGELEPFLGAGGPAADLSGPPVMLPVGVAQPLAMAVHELGTNAVKHGALSVHRGRVRVAWAVAGGLLRLRWEEAGGPPVAGSPERRGFGSRVLEATIGRQLGGAVSLAWRPAGLLCELTVPLARGAGAAAAGGAGEAMAAD